jgi:hypothetical protein
MTFLDDLNERLLKTYLEPLFRLLLPAAQDNEEAAWDAALDAVLGYGPQSQAELAIVCQLIVYSMQSAQTAAKAGAPDLSPADIARLCKAATTFAREAEKLESRLEKLRNDRGDTPVNQPATLIRSALRPLRVPPPPAQPEPAETPQADTAETTLSPAVKEEIRRTAAYARTHNLTYAQACAQLERENGRQPAEAET